MPISRPPPDNSANAPSGKRVAASASRITPATRCDVSGCAGCARSTTGQPTASAEAVSPPATENASGKLLAANTAAGPRATSCERTSGRGGVRAGSAASTRVSRQASCSARSANCRSCVQVRVRSPLRRASGNALSRWTVSSRLSPSASMPSAIARSRRARSAPGRCENSRNAAAAPLAAKSTSRLIIGYPSRKDRTGPGAAPLRR